MCPGREEGGRWGMNVPDRIGWGKNMPSSKRRSGYLAMWKIYKTFTTMTWLCDCSLWLRLDLLWGQGLSFLLPLEPVGMWRILCSRAHLVSLGNFLVHFLPGFQLLSVKILVYVLRHIVSPFPRTMDCVPSHGMLFLSLQVGREG